MSEISATVDQHGHHVVVGSGLSAGIRDLGVDEVVEARPGGQRPPPCRRVDSPLQLHDLRQLVGEVQQGLKLFTKEVGVGGEALAEQRLGGAAPDRGAALLVDVQPAKLRLCSSETIFLRDGRVRAVRVPLLTRISRGDGPKG